MTLCAGVCSYEGRGGLCSIRLSEPLLKFRPRKDLIETLLHEMIHAYLFVTNNDRDHDSHGPEFLKHMHRLNKLTGANITVYHTFHDEVDNYRVHWWLCNGPCRKRPPFFGYVKRAMNRPPSSRDPWWSDHQHTCGGVFEKVKEPEKKSRRTNFDNEKVLAKSSGSHSINKWFSSDQDVKSVKKPADFTAKPESTKTSAGQSGGIWGEFDCDSVPDVLLLTAADAAECEIKMEHSQPDGERHFPGQGHKLCKDRDTHVPVGSIVRRIPGIGVISGRSVMNRSHPRDNLVSSRTVNAATNLPLRQSPSGNTLSPRLLSSSDTAVASHSKLSISPVKYESAADFRKTIGMVLSPPGTEVRVKNFTSVCNHSARPLLNQKDPRDAPRLKAGRLLSDNDTDVTFRPTKKVRTDIEDVKPNITLSSDSKNLASDCRTENNKHSQQNMEQMNTYNSNTPSSACGILGSSADQAASARIDRVVVGTGSNLFFEQTHTVDCPVCRVPVPASAINEHLDQCLA